jgi:CubicO group peptidase (beta-lactamase class C family)
MRATVHSAFEIVREAIRSGPIPGATLAVGGADGVQFAHFGHTSSVFRRSFPANEAMQNPSASSVLSPSASSVLSPSASSVLSPSVSSALNPSASSQPEPVSLETIYDLASLTKVVLTTTLLIKAVQDGVLDPCAKLETIIPEISGFDLADATIVELASHSAGLAAFSKLRFLNLPRAPALQRSLQEPRVHPRGTVLYSDQGFIALGTILERVLGARLDDLADDLFKPLGLGLSFHPDPARCAPTEFVPERDGLICGLVHDENAAALDGVAGHAGLFGSVRDVVGFITALLDERIVSRTTLEFMFKERARSPLERRAFGWARRSDGWSGGDAAPDTALGHTGFTGTGLWFDPPSRRFFALLTNRVNPSRHTETGIRELRQAVGNAVWTD